MFLEARKRLSPLSFLPGQFFDQQIVFQSDGAPFREKSMPAKILRIGLAKGNYLKRDSTEKLCLPVKLEEHLL